MIVLLAYIIMYNNYFTCKTHIDIHVHYCIYLPYTNVQTAHTQCIYVHVHVTPQMKNKKETEVL